MANDAGKMSTMDAYRNLVNHTFLPPQLPQSYNNLSIDGLLGSTSEALAAFKLVRADASLNAPIRMLESART
ncbi:hypothetical protein B0A55_13173, partial [Friedmanniomyces simplex]